MKPHLLVLENFQSVRDLTEIPIRSLTFLYGPNSAGKSCIDDAFSLISAAFSAWDARVNSMLNRWIHVSPESSHPKKQGNPVTRLVLHCTVGRIFDGISDTGVFGELVRCEGGLIDWFEKCKWNIALSLETESDEMLSITLSAGGEPIFRIVKSEEIRLQISTKGFGETYKRLADKHRIQTKKRQKYHGFECELNLNSPLTLSAHRDEDFATTITSIVNAMLADIRHLKLSPVNLGADRATIRNSSLNFICGDRHREECQPNSGASLPPDFHNSPVFDMGIRNSEESGFLFRLADSAYRHAYCKRNPSSPKQNASLADHIEGLLSWHEDTSTNHNELLHEFVNRCLRDHLFLDQGYQLVFDALEILPGTDIGFKPLSAALMVGYLVDNTHRKMTFEDVGTGLSCVIPVLVALHSGSSFIQQPELHLHPALQSALGDVFVEATKTMGAYHFIETHSEYILLRCLRRVRETSNGKHLEGSSLAVRPEDISIVYFEPQPDGCTRVKSIRVSTQGDFIDRWPRGFFEERGKELFDE